jgi:hypothetical protein
MLSYELKSVSVEAWITLPISSFGTVFGTPIMVVVQHFRREILKVCNDLLL